MSNRINIQKLKNLSLLFLIGVLLSTNTFCQNQSRNDEIKYPNSFGGSVFMILNIFPDPADYYQLNYGIQFTNKDHFIVEAITWKYNEPLGTYGNSEELYPGKVRAYGIGIGYKRFLWRNLFITGEPTFFLQQFYNENNEKTQKGFQLYMQGILGYRIEFFKKRFFIEPAYALKYWPVNTNFPENFAAVENGKPKYIFEPHFNFGIKF